MYRYGESCKYLHSIVKPKQEETRRPEPSTALRLASVHSSMASIGAEWEVFGVRHTPYDPKQGKAHARVFFFPRLFYSASLSRRSKLVYLNDWLIPRFAISLAPTVTARGYIRLRTVRARATSGEGGRDTYTGVVSSGRRYSKQVSSVEKKCEHAGKKVWTS